MIKNNPLNASTFNFLYILPSSDTTLTAKRQFIHNYYGTSMTCLYTFCTSCHLFEYTMCFGGVFWKRESQMSSQCWKYRRKMFHNQIKVKMSEGTQSKLHLLKGSNTLIEQNKQQVSQQSRWPVNDLAASRGKAPLWLWLIISCLLKLDVISLFYRVQLTLFCTFTSIVWEQYAFTRHFSMFNSSSRDKLLLRGQGPSAVGGWPSF